LYSKNMKQAFFIKGQLCLPTSTRSQPPQMSFSGGPRFSRETKSGLKMKGTTGVGSVIVELIVLFVRFAISVGGGGGGMSTGEAEIRTTRMLRAASKKWRGPNVLMMV